VTLPAEVAAAPAVAADLTEAAGQILDRERLHVAAPVPTPREGRRGGCVLVVRADSAGDVLVTGPAIRAVAAGADRVVLLCGPRGRAAAELLPGVDELLEWRLPWIDPVPDPVDVGEVAAATARIAALGATEAVIFTSFHQSALPLALLLRMAGIRRVSAISDDYPGSLLDVRHRVPAGIPEAERALSLAAAAGFPPPPGDDLRLRLLTGPATGTLEDGPRLPIAPGTVAGTAGDELRLPVAPGAATAADEAEPPYVVVHPGTSVDARACPPDVCRRIVEALAAAGHRVLVTGSPDEKALTAEVAGEHGTDLGGATGLAGLAALIAGADCLVVGNTGPAHLAAAVGTPVVSLFAPTVPFGQWGPHRVPCVRLGDATAACRDTRAARCPVPGHPCLSAVDPARVVAAVAVLTDDVPERRTP
jgi:ADP-heptose:LPS heptosyltransferase